MEKVAHKTISKRTQTGWFKQDEHTLKCLIKKRSSVYIKKFLDQQDHHSRDYIK